MTSRELVRRLAGIRAWVVVGAFVVVSTAVRTALAKTHPAPWIFDDELIYSQLAGSLARTGHFAARSVPGLQGYGPGYPALIAPAYVAFDNLAHAYAAAKAINSLLMSLAAFPAYYLARRVVSHPLALFASLFALLIPSLEYTGTIMTENAFYPAFLVCALALVCALERPTAVRQLLALAAIGGAFVIRAQAVALAAGFVTAIVVFVAAEAWTDARPGRLRSVAARLRAFAWTWGTLAVGLVLVLLVQHARGRSLGSSLGAYRDVTSWSYSVGGVARWYVRHLAELDLYLGFVPLIATIVIAAESLRRRSPDRALRAFAAVSVSMLVWVPLTASALSSQLAKADGIGRIEERNAFYVAPLCLIALLAWVERRVPRPWLVAVPAAGLAAVLPWTIPYSKFVNLGALSDTLAFIPLARLELQGSLASSHVARVLGVAALAAALVFLLLPRRLALLIPLGVLAYLVVWQIPIERQMRGTSEGVLAESIGTRREWIDEAVKGRGQVAAVWTGNVNPNTIAENEFFNSSVARVYSAPGAPPLGQQLPEIPATVDERSGRLREGTVPLRADYLLTDPSITPAGRPVARDARIGMTLFHTGGAVRLRETATGLYGDRWSGPELTFVRYGCRGGTLLAIVANDPRLIPKRQRLVASVGGRARAALSIGPTPALRAIRVPLRSSGDRCEAVFRISPTAVPARVLGGPDTRELGLRFDVLYYAAP